MYMLKMGAVDTYYRNQKCSGKLMTKLSLSIAIFLSFTSISSARDCNDTLYRRLAQTPILNMNQDEYQYFRKHEGRCEKYDCLIDSQIVWIGKKLISDMSLMEADYFADRATDIAWCNPCSLGQYLAIRDKNQDKMTKYERMIYDECKDGCQNLIKQGVYSERGLSRRKPHIFGIVALTLVGTIGVLMLLWFTPSGPR